MAIASFIKWNLLFFVLFVLTACSGGGDDDSSVVPRDAGSVEGYHIVEGDSDSSPLTLYFISPVDGLINYNTFNITAAAQSDYLPIEGTLQVEKDKEYAFYVTIYGDEKVEGTESFGINFIDTSGMSLGTVIGQIVNDDLPSVSSNSPEITETDIGTSVLSFEISLSEPVVDSYSLTVNTISFSDLSGTQKTQFPYVAMPDKDYERFDQIITFENGEINKIININVISENIVEEDEVVLLEFKDDEGTSVIKGGYAIGTIRSDETKDTNGFNLLYEGQPGLKNILEGTPPENEADIWKKINLPVSIDEPDNIKQEQILVFNILNLTEAQNKGYISPPQTQSEQSELEESYISTSINADICFNTPKEPDASDCEISTEYLLLTEDKSLQLEFYVRGDNFRELDETYIIALGNDQGVNFTNISGIIKNDDSERINIFYEGEYNDLIEFTSAGKIYEVNEPNGNADSDVLIDFQLPSALQIKYDLEYSVTPYTGNGTAAEGNKDYDAQQSNVEGALNFEKGIGLQTRQLALTLKGDGQYDGDKDLKITFKNTSIEPLIIRIKDNDFPSVNIYKNQNADSNDTVSQLEVFEPLESQSNQDGYKEYLFYLRMTGAYAALSDIEYNVKITSQSSLSGDANECISLGRDSTISKPDINDDFEIHYGDPLERLNSAEDDFVIKKGSIQSKWVLRIKQDSFIECIEEFKVSFTPASQNVLLSDDEKAEIIFKIIDTDKALITVESWQTDETDAATKTQNFKFNSNKKVNAVLTPVLTGEGLNCNADDLDPPTDAATTVSFTPDSLESTFPIYIKGDTTVEPKEACKLTAGDIGSDLENLIEVQYLDTNGAVIEDATHATGFIENDDKLNISFDIATQVAEPTNKNEETGLGFIHWSSNNDIAENVDDIIVTFANAVCTNNADDCIEYSAAADAETDIKISPDSLYLNDAVFNQTNNRFEKALPISILGDDIVEPFETLNISVKSDTVYIQSIPSVITTKIVNEDKLTISFTENTLSPLMAALNGSESGSRFYDITWGEKTVASTVPEITLNLNHNDSTTPGVATRNVAAKNASGAPKEFDYSLEVAGSLNFSNQLTLKESGSDLQSNGSLRVELILEDDSIIEEIETIEFTLSSTLTDFINAFTVTKSHEIGIDDKLLVEFTPPNDYTYKNIGSSEEKNEEAIDYSIGVTGIVDSDVPELKLGLTNTGNADLFENNDGDYTFNITGSDYENNFITIKEVNSGLASSSIMLTLNIKEDDYVEVQERIITTLSNNAVNFNYIELKDTAGTIVDSIQFTHNIFSEDLTNFSIEQAAGGVNTSKEEDEVTNTYILSWANPIGKNVPELVFDLPFSGSAIKNSDYILIARDASKLTITDFEIPSNPTVTVERLTINKSENAVLPAGSVLLNVKIVDDVDVEGDELVTASFKSLDESFPGTHQDMPYLTFSDIKDSISHTITSEEGVTVTLTKSTASLSGLERDEREIFYTLSWTQAIEKSVGDIPLQVVFTGSADVNSDYSLESSDNGKLTVDPSTGIFTIKNKGNGLSANSSVQFKVTLIDEDLVEPQETIDLSLNTHGTTPSIIGVKTADDTTYTILIDSNSDKTRLNLTEIGTKPASSNEKDKTAFAYKLQWKKPVASNVPEMFVDIPLTGSASMDDIIVEADSPAIFTIIRGDDDSILSADRFNGYRLIFKKVGESIAKDGSVTFKVTVNNDEIVETNEELSGSLTIPDPLLAYAKLGSNISLSSHTINSDDKLTLSLIPDANNPASSTEDDEQTLGFTLSWDKQVASNVPALIVDLPMSRNGSLADFSVKSTDDLAVSGDEYTLKADNTALDSSGSVTFSYTVINDNEVEIAEVIASALTLDTSTYYYLSQYIEEPTINDSFTHTINSDSDKTVISLTKVVGTFDAADEESESSISYNLAWTNPVAKDVPALSVDLNLSDSSATEGDTKDYIVDTLPSGLVRAGDIFTFKAAGTALSKNGFYTLSFTIKDDEIVETDETIEGELAYSGNLSTYAGLSETNFAFTHAITNKDKTILSLAIDSGSPSSSEDSEDTTTYNLVSSHAVANDVTSLKVTMPITGTATAASDYIFTDMTLSKAADVYTIPTPITAGSTINSFSIAVDDEEFVETKEAFIATLALQPETESVAELVGSSKSVTHTIINDDFINITFNNESNLNEGDSVQYTVEPYKSSGLSGANITQTLSISNSNSFYASGNLADITSASNISHTIVDNFTSAVTTTLFSIENDKIIEPDESFTIPLDLSAYSDYVKVNDSVTTGGNNIEYTITDNDKLEVQLDKFHIEDNVIASNPYYMQLCYPYNPTIQGDHSIVFNSVLRSLNTSDSDVLGVNSVEDSDFSSAKSTVTFDLTSNFTLSGGKHCQQAELFKTNLDSITEGTEWLNIDLSLSESTESRVKGTNLSDVDIVIIDNDFPHMTQSGATKCINSSGNLVANPNTSQCDSFGSKQDHTRAEAVNGTHPEQHFTVITNGQNTNESVQSGEPSKVPPEKGGTDFNGDNGYCLFDSYSNNAWLVGGFYIDTNLNLKSTERIQFYDDDTSVKTALSIQTQAQADLSWCGLSSGDSHEWRLPTVAELLTILNIENLRGAVELSNNSDVVLTSYFQHHYNDSANTDEGNNASQTDCQISNPASCGTGLSTITSYYWASESCTTESAINASVDAGTARANATAKRDAATVARAYADSLAADDPNKTAAEDAAVSAENEATATENEADTSEQTASDALAAQNHAWVVDFATAQLSCLPKTDTAHIRLVYKPI